MLLVKVRYFPIWSPFRLRIMNRIYKCVIWLIVIHVTKPITYCTRSRKFCRYCHSCRTDAMKMTSSKRNDCNIDWEIYLWWRIGFVSCKQNMSNAKTWKGNVAFCYFMRVPSIILRIRITEAAHQLQRQRIM